MHLLKRTAILLCMLCTHTSVGQQYNFHNYSVKDGVAQSQVFSLVQDARGYLWMGTRGGGLTRFDGTEFKTFAIKDGLPNNYVSRIKEDNRHNLWIGTNNGLSEYNGIAFTNYYPEKNTVQFSVQDIAFDAKERKWLATSTGVFLLDGNTFTNVTSLLKEEPAVVNAIHCDKKGNVWYGNAKGLFRITEQNSNFSVTKFDKAKGFMNNSITCINEDAGGKLWIGTYGDGAYVYNGTKFYRIDLQQELYKQTVLDVYFDNRGNAWLATLAHGVAQYNMLAGSFTWLTEQEGLSNNHVRSIIQDKSGNYWFGTSGGGVCNYFGKQFTVYDKSSGLGGNFIYSIFRDSKKRLWIGTSDRGLSLLDSSKFYNFNADNGFENVKVKAITEDNAGTLYFGTDGQGVYTYDETGFKFLDALGKKYIRAMVKDKDGQIWIATAGAGLYKMDVRSSKQELTNYSVKDGLLHNRLTSLLYDKSGRLWYGTENNGLGYVLNGILQKETISVKNGLPSNAIRCMTEDKSGYLWLGTAGDGIASMPLYQGNFRIKTYDHKNGLSSSNIYLISCDKRDHIFTGTETGLDHLILGKDRRPLEIKHYSKGEGFTGIETCQNAVYNDADGTIWFGTINGLIKYNPANLVKNEHEPVTTITNVKLFYIPVANTTFKNSVGDWNSVKGLDLPYDQNHLTFDFLAINFSNPDAVKYQWMLKGFDKAWSPVSTQHTFSYPNLGAGDYTFMVKACNEDGVWNRKPVELQFHISPPFWLRWWFILLLVITFSGVLFMVFKWRINRVKFKAAEEQKKTQLEKEVVELEQKALRLQMNPHFIFNALNSIQSQIGTDNEQQARYYLAKFSRLMRQILDNSRQAAITLEEEINTLENYLLIEKFCNGDRFDYTITMDPELEKDYIKIPPMLLQPFIENAIKHGLKFSNEKRGFIGVSFSEINNLLECSVTDNGVGRKKAEELNSSSKETYHKSTALLVTQERLDLLKEDKNIRSLEIIDLYDENGEATGTKVIVRIPIN
jgi:ligand-binding sensor domain-containing protein